MNAAISLLCLIGLTIVKGTEDVIYKAEMKIIGGHPVDIKYRPFMLSLYNTRGYMCGASILSRRWGITALHCLVSVNATNYYVRAGSTKPYEGGTVHRVTKIHVYNQKTHPYWFSRMLYHDIALFEVSPRFRFSETVRPARLPSANSTPPHTLYVCGWGYTAPETDEESGILMGVYVRRVPFESCIKATPDYETLVKKDYHLCYGSRGKDSCYGDSGGPLASRNTIFGVVSFGQNCGVVPGVYAKVSYYRRWIKDVTNL